MARPVRVVFVDDTFTFGGAITSLGHLVAGLRPWDLDITVVSGQDIDVLHDLFPGVRAYSRELRLPWVHTDPFAASSSDDVVEKLGPLTRVARSLYWVGVGDISPAIAIGRIAHRHRADIIHLNNGWQLDGALAAKALGTRCIAHVRGMWAPRPPRKAPLVVGMGRKALRTLRYDLVPPHMTLAVSGAVARNVLRRKVPSDRVRVVHDAIDLDVFHPGAAPEGLLSGLGVPDGALVVGHFGRVIPWKGTLEFVRGFAGAAETLPDVHALVVGDASDGGQDYEDSVHAEVERLGLSARVTFTGFRPDVADIMRACDIVVHSSTRSEPFGMVIVEGMATGNALIAADAGGPLEIIRDGIDGFLVDPTDAAAMAGRIRELATDEPLRRRIARAGIERTRQQFSKERYAADVIAAYEETMGTAVGRR